MRLLAVACGIGLSAFVLGAGELAIRWFCPFVHFQGTSRELYQYEQGRPGWKPMAQGTSFGAPCQIDELSCRVVGQSESPTRSWLVLGDSVAFGVGVDGTKTFAGLIQAACPNVRVLNSGVCGAGGREQFTVSKRLIDSVTPPIDRISLFYCLNDIGEIEFDEQELGISARALHPENRPGLVKSLVEWVRSRSKLYVLLKGLLTDPPTRYFQWELEKYRRWTPETPGDVASILKIAELAQGKQIEFQVFLLPYVAQYGSPNDDAWLPQQKMTAYLLANNIDVVETRHWFEGSEMKSHFLFADGCHFSEKGHQLVFEQLMDLFGPD